MTYSSSPLSSIKSPNNSSTKIIGGTNTLNNSIDNSTTTIPLNDASQFPDDGCIHVDNEHISYFGKDGNNLINCVRGDYLSIAASHNSNAIVSGVFVGQAEKNNYPDVMSSSILDIDGKMYYEFSNDGIEWDSFPDNGFVHTANEHELHVSTKGFRYFRVHFITMSTQISTKIAINIYYGVFSQANLPLNESIKDDADSIVVRAVSTAKDPNNIYVNARSIGYHTETNKLLVNTTINNDGELGEGTTSLTVTDSTGLNEGDYIKVDEEFMKINSISSNILTIDRAQFRSTDTSHDNGTTVFQVFDGGIIDTTGYTQFQIELYTDVAGEFNNISYNGLDNDSQIIRLFNLPFSKTTGLILNSFPIPSRYFRFTVVPSETGHTVFNFRTKMLNTAISGQTLGVEDVVVGTMSANLQRSIVAGKQPDGDYVNTPADGEAFSTTTILSADETFISSWVDSDGWNCIEIIITSDVVSAINGIIIEFTDDTQTDTPVVRVTRYSTYNDINVTNGYFVLRIPPMLDGFRIRYTNGSTAQTDFYLAATLKINGYNDSYNAGQAIITADFESEVALGNISNYELATKFGRNPKVNVGPQDIWQYGDTYTGQPLSSPETITVHSTSANDTAMGTGARTVRIEGLKTSNSILYQSEDITLNGTSEVVSNCSWWRVNDASVLTAGDSGQNEGNIQIEHTVTSSNIFAYIKTGFNTSLIAAYTVPSQKMMLIKKVTVSITRKNASSGSAHITLRARKPGNVYIIIASYDVQTGVNINDVYSGGIKLPAGTDIKFTCESVSDGNTVPNASMDFMLLNIKS